MENLLVCLEDLILSVKLTIFQLIYEYDFVLTLIRLKANIAKKYVSNRHTLF